MSSLPAPAPKSGTAGVRQTGIATKTGSRCRIRRGRPGPVGIAVAVDVIDLEGAAGGIHPNATQLLGERRLVTTVPTAPLLNVSIASDTSSNSTGRAIRAARPSTVSHGPNRWSSRSI